MAKFVVFEKVSEAIFAQTDKANLSGGAVTGINLGSGVIAGFAAAIVSQPADTMLSKINKTKGEPGEGTTSRLIKIAKELGLKGSYAGIGARLFMVGTLVSLLPYCGATKGRQLCRYICCVHSDRDQGLRTSGIAIRQRFQVPFLI